jgi:sialic acid synthase SpsE
LLIKEKEEMLTFTSEDKPSIIADAASRHYGSASRALELVDAAHLSGVDAIVFDATDLGEQSLSQEDWSLISCVCAERGLHFGATCWEPASIDKLNLVSYKPSFWKVADTATHKADLIEKLDNIGRTILLSTGLSTIVQIDETLRMIKKAPVVLMQSTNIYPCPYDKINLRVIQTLIRRYGIPVGYSSHENGHHISVAAIGAGAVALEKGFMLGDDSDPKEAYEYAISSVDMLSLVQCVQHLFPAIGDGAKTIYKEEMKCEEMIIEK